MTPIRAMPRILKECLTKDDTRQLVWAFVARELKGAPTQTPGPLAVVRGAAPLVTAIIPENDSEKTRKVVISINADGKLVGGAPNKMEVLPVRVQTGQITVNVLVVNQIQLIVPTEILRQLGAFLQKIYETEADYISKMGHTAIRPPVSVLFPVVGGMSQVSLVMLPVVLRYLVLWLHFQRTKQRGPIDEPQPLESQVVGSVRPQALEAIGSKKDRPIFRRTCETLLRLQTHRERSHVVLDPTDHVLDWLFTFE
jgi:hypothetical protein